jgi:hypothetical protein
MATANVSAPTVRIRRHSWTATVRRGPIDAISKILGVTLRRFDLAADGRLLTTEEDVVFFTSVGKGTIMPPSGLVPRLAKGLRAAGYQVSIKDRRLRDPLDDADLSFRQLPAADGWIRQLCEAIVREPRGQILLSGREEVAQAIAQVLRLFPRRSICVVVKDKSRIRLLHRQLTDLTARKVAIDPRRVWDTKPRTLLCLPRLASSCRPEDFDIMLYADVESVTAKPTATCDMQRDAGTRLYAVLPPGRRLDLYQQLALEAATGPVIFDRARAAGSLPKVHVWYAGPASYPAQEFTRDPLQRKRTNLWHNQARNRLIAQLAGGIADRDTATLRELGLHELGEAVGR